MTQSTSDLLTPAWTTKELPVKARIHSYLVMMVRVAPVAFRQLPVHCTMIVVTESDLDNFLDASLGIAEILG